MWVLKFLSFFLILFTVFSIFHLYFVCFNGATVINQDKFSAIEQHEGLGQGFHLAQKDMNIRGFGNAFGEEQTGNIGNVGTDLYFEMLFESLSKVKKYPRPPHPPWKEKRKKEHRHRHLHNEKVIIVLLLIRSKKTGFYQSPTEMFRYCFSIFFSFLLESKCILCFDVHHIFMLSTTIEEH